MFIFFLGLRKPLKSEGDKYLTSHEHQASNVPPLTFLAVLLCTVELHLLQSLGGAWAPDCAQLQLWAGRPLLTEVSPASIPLYTCCPVALQLASKPHLSGSVETFLPRPLACRVALAGSPWSYVSVLVPWQTHLQFFQLSFVQFWVNLPRAL